MLAKICKKTGKAVFAIRCENCNAKPECTFHVEKKPVKSRMVMMAEKEGKKREIKEL